MDHHSVTFHALDTGETWTEEHQAGQPIPGDTVRYQGKRYRVQKLGREWVDQRLHCDVAEIVEGCDDFNI